MSDKLITSGSIFNTFNADGKSPKHIFTVDGVPIIKFYKISGINLQQAQAICDLLNNWSEDD